MKKLLAILLCFTFCVVLLAGCGKDSNNAGDDTSSTPADTAKDTSTGSDTQPDDTDDKSEVFTISTPFADLKYPAKWIDKVDVLSDETHALFACDGYELFDITVNSEGGVVLGTILSNDGNKVLRFISADLDDSIENFDEFCEMQEDVNVILDNLSKDYNFDYGSVVANEESDVFAIETPYATLYYPEKWKNRITFDVTDDKVIFSSSGVELFKIDFGGGSGIPLGTYKGTSVSVDVEELDEAGLSESDYDDYCAMQEDYNVILQHLRTDENFTIIGAN